MSHAYNPNSIDLELQVRLMNLVMGEASDFERDQLQLLMEQRPELVAFYQHLEHLHGLLCVVGAGELSIDAEVSNAENAWQLPNERREKLLAVLDGNVEKANPKVLLASTASKKWLTLRASWMAIGVVAAAACVLIGFSQYTVTQHGSIAMITRPRFSAGTDKKFLAEQIAANSSLPSAYYVQDDVTYFPSSAATNGGAYRNQATAKPGELDFLSSQREVDAIVPSASSTSAPSARFSQPGVQLAAPKAYSLATSDGKQAGGAAQPNVNSNEGFDVYGVWGARGEKPAGMGGKPGGMGGPAFGSPDNSGPAGVGRQGDGLGVGGYGGGGYGGSGFGNAGPGGEGRHWQYEQFSAAGIINVPASQLGTAVNGQEDLFGSNLGNQPTSSANSNGQSYGNGLPLHAGQAVASASVPSDSTGYGASEGASYNLNSAVELPKSEETILDRFDVELGLTWNRLDAKAAVSETRELSEAANRAKNEAQAQTLVDQYHDLTQAGRWAEADEVSRKVKELAIDPEIVLYNKAKIRRSDELQLPGIAALNENNLSSEFSTTVSAPDGGTIFLGGIKRLREGRTELGTPILSKIPYLNQLFKNNAIGRETDTLMMNVTPRIIIPEEEEEALGQFTRDTNESKVAEILEQVDTSKNAEVVGKSTQNLQNGKDRLQEIELEKSLFVKDRSIRDESAPESSLASILDGKTKTGKESLGEEKRGEVSLGLKSAPAPSPEVAASGRRGINAEAKPAGRKQPRTLDEQSATTESFSTFSLHVSDVSFKLAQAALGQGQWPEATKVRIEEFVNAMDYHDPLPSGNQKVACRVEQAIHPFLMQRNLLRVSMRTAATGRSQNTPLRLTILLDNSGSMERVDRRQAVLRSFESLTKQLSTSDQITLISFANTPRLLADKVPGNQSNSLLQLIENLPSEGGTNIEAALLLAQEKATEQQLAGAQNRIVMLTDGAVNLGNANPESLAKLVTQLRDAGIAFDAAGISAQDLNDEVLEALTRQGDGRYYLLDSAEAAGEAFAAQIAGALRPSAQNVKVQVEFNPQRVGRYKLLGFEKHRLNKEDFRNDQVDAAEMAAAEAGVAVYQYEIKPNGIGDVGSVSVRFRDLSTNQMVERRWPILYESNTPRLEQAQASMQLATCAALFAAKLGGGPLADSVDLAQLQKLLTKLPEQFASQPRVQQLRAMIEQANAIGH